MTILLWAMALLTIIVIVGFSVRVAIFVRLCPRLLPTDVIPTVAPLISVVVPARNEAANIERCIRSLQAQTYPNLEIIVVDDRSTDATPQILARLAAEHDRLRVMAGKPLPPGWLGKSHAVAQGAQQAKGVWLLFVDADVALHPGALSGAYLVARQHGATMLSLWARQELLTRWERIVQPVIISLGHAIDPFQRVNSARHPNISSANGQFILVERAAYDRIGGHAAVRNEVVEDQRLSWHLKRAGERILMLDGTRMLNTRMYTSLRGMWDGWSKNNFLMLGRNYFVVFLAILTVYFITVSPLVLLIYALLMQIYTLALITILLISALLIIRWQVRSYFTSSLRDSPWYPIGGLIFIGIILNSAYQHSRGRGVLWKGRRCSDATLQNVYESD
jgi:chlorobactene glucosyltransferase